MVLNFYEVDNEGKNAKSHYILAKNKEDAMRIAATQPGKPVRCRKMKPECNISKLCEAGKSGLLCKKIQMVSIKDIFSDYKPTQPENPWEIYKEI